MPDEKTSIQQITEFIEKETEFCSGAGLETIIKVQLAGFQSGKLSRYISLTEDDILAWADEIKRKNPARQVVREFVGEDLWPEVVRRIEDGQAIGQAFMNAGDHADRPYSWQLPNRLHDCTTWTQVAIEITTKYGTKAAPIAYETIVPQPYERSRG